MRMSLFQPISLSLIREKPWELGCLRLTVATNIVTEKFILNHNGDKKYIDSRWQHYSIEIMSNIEKDSGRIVLYRKRCCLL